MIKKVLIALMAFVFVFGTVSAGLALEKGNKRKGKYTYRKVYKACFERGAIESKTPPLSPADKTQEEWNTVFESKVYYLEAEVEYNNDGSYKIKRNQP